FGTAAEQRYRQSLGTLHLLRFDLRHWYHLHRHGAPCIFGFRVVRRESCLGHRFRLCGDWRRYFTSRAAEGMVTVDLAMAAGLSDLFRYRAAIAVTLGLNLLPAWTFRRKT